MDEAYEEGLQQLQLDSVLRVRVVAAQPSVRDEKHVAADMLHEIGTHLLVRGYLVKFEHALDWKHEHREGAEVTRAALVVRAAAVALPPSRTAAGVHRYHALDWYQYCWYTLSCPWYLPWKENSCK